MHETSTRNEQLVRQVCQFDLSAAAAADVDELEEEEKEEMGGRCGGWEGDIFDYGQLELFGVDAT